MQKQYGAIPYMYEKGKLKVVMITSASAYWIFPKGRFEEELGKTGTAELEALEEAGVEGKADKKISYQTEVFIKNGDVVCLILYPLKVKTIYDEWDEDYRRKRKVLTIKEAKKLITSDALVTCLKKFEADFES